MRPVVVFVAVGAMVACQSGRGPEYIPREDPPGTTPPTTSTTPPTTTPPGTTPTTPTEPIDCTGVIGNYQKLDIPASEDFTIGVDGLLYGVSTETDALIRSDHDGNVELLAPNISSWGRGTRFLPGGDLVVAEPDAGRMLRFDPSTWGYTVIAGNLSEPNGVAVGDDGFVHLTQSSGVVLRIDPDTADRETLYDTPVSNDGISFAPDYRTLYWDSESGEIIRVVLDDYGEVIDGPTVLTVIPPGPGFSILDGLTVDACGNLYVVMMSGYIHRVFPDGSQEVFLDLSGAGNPFISAVNFGNGYGGFEKTNLYVMDLNGGVFEVEVGIPGKWEPHWP